MHKRPIYRITLLNYLEARDSSIALSSMGMSCRLSFLPDLVFYERDTLGMLMMMMMTLLN